MNTKGTSILRSAEEGALINVIFRGSSVPACKCTLRGRTRTLSMRSPCPACPDQTWSRNSLERKKDLPRWSTSLRICLDCTETRRLLPPSWPFSCSKTMAGTRPALRSLAATCRPEEARGTARINSSCLASGRGWPGR
uniref:Uncharacterized protein n=1 Tax=Arundo donax TaxID=35708 RepID=A0A0A9DMM0_ARUDO